MLVCAARLVAVSLCALACSAWGGEPVILQSGDQLSFKFGTTQQFEAASYSGNRGNWPDRQQWRRGRINAALGLHERWEARVEYDFAAHSGVTDAHLAYDDHQSWLVTLGQAKQPVGLDASAGDRNGVFMERGLSFAFAPKRAPGIVVLRHRQTWTASAGAFGTPLGAVQAGDEGFAAAARVTVAPVLTATRILHLGVGVNWREPPNGNGSDASGAHFSTVRFRSKPESDIDARYLVDTGQIRNVSHYQLADLELAGESGPLSLQAEYTWVRVARDGAQNAQFTGWYAQLAYSLTRELRPYRAERGTFESVLPSRPIGKGGYGAVEVAARVSEVNLNDAGVNGGHAHNAAIALNWYLNSHWRLGANAIKVLHVHGGPLSGQTPTICQLRIQLAL